MASYWRMFRLIFVLFFLYLLADVFYRWDGFRHYGSLSEFIPSIALISILWAIVAALTALLALKLTKLIESLLSFTGKKIKAEHLLIFGCFLVLIGKVVWIGKIKIFGGGSIIQTKIVVLTCVINAAILFTWLLRNKLTIIQERITPLVFLFGFIVILSFPIVSYHAWMKKPQQAMLQQEFKSADENKSNPNIILVTFDALRTLDMSAYGYYRDTTPFIKKWAEEATVFTKAYSAGTTTSTTTSSLMTGKRLWNHLRFTQIHGNIVNKSKTDNIALELKNKGYYNIGITANANASIHGMGIADSFDYIAPWSEVTAPTNAAEFIKKWLYNLFGGKIRIYEWLVMEDFAFHKILTVISLFRNRPYPTEMTISKFLKHIDNNMQEPFFAWLHFHPPHDPYTPPKPFIGMFDNSSNLTKLKEQYKYTKGSNYAKLDPEERKRVFKILRARYDEHIRYSDESFKNLIYQLEKRGKLKNSVIILSSDHGESFEHDRLGHGSLLYEQVTHIPLIIKEPNQVEGRVIDSLTEQVDISATILDLAGVPVPSWMDGRSLVPLMHGAELSPRPAFSMWLAPNTSGRLINAGAFAVWEGDYKLIYDLGKKDSMLFNLKLNPDELNNLIDIEPEVGEHLRNLILDNLSKVNAKIR